MTALRLRNLAWLGPLAAATPAAQGQTLAPVSLPLGDAELRLNADAGGALFDAHQPGASVPASGVVRLMPEIRRDYDSGLSLGLAATVAAEDPLSRGRYDGDALERLVGVVRTGLGTGQIGLTDGAGYVLAVTGPKVDAGASLEDPRTGFFQDPSGRAAQPFALRTAVGASSNYAKFVYASPSLFGVTLALSFTPSEGKQLPFLNAGPQQPGRQADIWEAALKYEDEIGPVSLSAYAAVAEGRAEHKLPGQEGVSDLGAGLRADYPVNDDITVSLGGSFRQSNAYGFDINQARAAATTRGGHMSAMVSDGGWRLGAEYGTAIAGAGGDLPRMNLNGSQISLGYRVSPSILVSTGWQHQGYTRDSGAFFNGSPVLKMNALFLHVALNTSED